MKRIKKWLPDARPLVDHPNYRRVFIGQWVSSLGSSITMVALGFQVYELTGSSFWVGLLGGFRLVPLTVAGFVAAPIADRVDRRRYLLWMEGCLGLISLGLYFVAENRMGVSWVLALAAASGWFDGMHRPAFDALMPRLVPKDLLGAVASWNGLRGTVALLIGPAIAGVILATFGLSVSYLIDAASFVIGLFFLFRVQGSFRAEGASVGRPKISEWIEGFHYARKDRVLLGSYLVDIASMIFTFPHALFPEMAKNGIFTLPATWAGASSEKVLGWYYAATGFGAMCVSIFSGWASRARFHGRAVVIGAIGWSVAIGIMAQVDSVFSALFFLAVAGGYDMVSGIFRSRIWNETIPDRIRSRLAAVEMASYMSGPLLGGTLLGAMSGTYGIRTTFGMGALVSVAVIVGLTIWLRPFWNYRAAYSSSTND
ncbi:MAG: MFS transporter [Bdellovibrionales bacterium]|nr:MFS transporter [Bdellovibrionales bacterium]